MLLTEIVWPVFKLGERKPICENNLVYFVSEYEDLDTGTHHGRIRLVDDLTIDKATIGLRRLVLKSRGISLSHIDKTIYFLQDLVKLAKSTTWFIDTAGVLFQYKKSQHVYLLCKKITRTLPADGLGAIIEVDGIASRFKTAFKPLPEQSYAGVLQLGISYIFYGFYLEPFKNSWRLL